jgi:hypothetical protein
METAITPPITGETKMTNAIAAYEAATTREEAQEAFDALVECIAADLELPNDADFVSGAEKALNDRGIARKH